MATYLIDSWYDQAKVFQRTGFSSTINASFSYSGAFGCCWDASSGNVLWGNADVTKAIKGTGFSSSVISSFTPAAATYDMEMLGSNFTFAAGTTKVRQQTGFSSTVGSSFTSGSTGFRAISNDGTNVFLWRLPTATGKLLKMSGFSSTVSSSFSAPASTGGSAGLAYDGTNMLFKIQAVDAVSFKYYQYSGFSSTVLSSFTVSTGASQSLAGLGWEVATSGPTNVKTWDGLALASVKTIDDLAIASVKTVDGLN